MEQDGKSHDIFYRVLYTPPHRRDWIEGYYHSRHGIPYDWFERWERLSSTVPKDYLPDCNGGYYSEKALKVFLKAAGEGRIKNLTEAEGNAICEQAGVSAFNSAEGAFNYLISESPAWKNNLDEYVEFYGKKLADDLVEGKGAVIAHVFKPCGSIMSRNEFAQRHQLSR
jgi:hypothetical protein